jgi:hypothetical protein
MAVRVVDDLSALARMKIFPLEWGSDWMQSVTIEAGGKLPPSRRVMVLSFSSPQFMIKGWYPDQGRLLIHKCQGINTLDCIFIFAFIQTELKRQDGSLHQSRRQAYA